LSGHYFTPREYVHRDNPSLLPIPADEPWQPDVYKLAGLVAHAVRATRIVDVGCGDAKKLQRLAAEHDVLGLDLLDVQVPEGVRFLPYDVLGPSPIPEAEGSLLIAADVIEHLGRPDVLLEKIRRSRCLGAVLSTPDRLSEYGYDHRVPAAEPPTRPGVDGRRVRAPVGTSRARSCRAADEDARGRTTVGDHRGHLRAVV